MVGGVWLLVCRSRRVGWLLGRVAGAPRHAMGSPLGSGPLAVCASFRLRLAVAGCARRSVRPGCPLPPPRVLSTALARGRPGARARGSCPASGPLGRLGPRRARLWLWLRLAALAALAAPGCARRSIRPGRAPLESSRHFWLLAAHACPCVAHALLVAPPPWSLRPVAPAPWVAPGCAGWAGCAGYAWRSAGPGCTPLESCLQLQLLAAHALVPLGRARTPRSSSRARRRALGLRLAAPGYVWLRSLCSLRSLRSALGQSLARQPRVEFTTLAPGPTCSRAPGAHPGLPERRAERAQPGAARRDPRHGCARLGQCGQGGGGGVHDPGARVRVRTGARVVD